jgi:2-dehydro-3-deoxy-D-arabinonate dehydratase
MQLCKIGLKSGDVKAAALAGDQVQLLKGSLSDILHAEQPAAALQAALTGESVRLADVTLLPPVDRQEIWAAGVTYKRSQIAREQESVGAARFYDLVYSAPRPELFFKATAARAVGPGHPVRVRRDSKWSVPEPELTLVISPKMKLVGFTIGNDMSARDIEGENPLYLPQAKVYQHSCALGPAITLRDDLPPLDQVEIRLSIQRRGKPVFEGATALTKMARSFDDLIDWLGRDNAFPDGVLLLTGTGIVPPDDFSLAAGDQVAIDISGIGRLANPVESV